MNGKLVIACLVASLAAAPGTAAPNASEAQAAPPGGGELREVLREYFVQLLVSDLGLSDAGAQAVAPLVKQLLDAQRETARERQHLVLELRDAATAEDATRSKAAVERFDAFEREAVGRLTGRRTAVVERLTTRQAARFLGFEERFRQRVRQLVDARGAGAGAPGQGPMDRVPEPDRGPGQRPDQAAPADARHDEVMETLKVLYVHEMRQEIDLPLDATLSMLPDLDALFEQRAAFEREHQAALRALRRAADDDSVAEPELERLVRTARELEERPLRLAEARHRVTRGLPPVRAAGFLAFEQRFWPDARRRARGLLRGAPGDEPGPVGRPWRQQRRPGVGPQRGPGGPQRGPGGPQRGPGGE